MFYPNTVWNSGNRVLDSATQKARKFVVARGLYIDHDTHSIMWHLAVSSAPRGSFIHSRGVLEYRDIKPLK